LVFSCRLSNIGRKLGCICTKQRLGFLAKRKGVLWFGPGGGGGVALSGLLLKEVPCLLHVDVSKCRAFFPKQLLDFP
jgi:hypothetical protein